MFGTYAPSVSSVNSRVVLALPDNENSDYRFAFGFHNQSSKPIQVTGQRSHMRTSFVNNNVTIQPGKIGVIEVAIMRNAIPMDLSYTQFSFIFETTDSLVPTIETLALLRRIPRKDTAVEGNLLTSR